MTPNESLAIRLANEVGATQYSTPPMRAVTGRSFTWDQLTRFVELAIAEEREACCSIVHGQCESDNVAQRTVDAIRARSKP